MSRREGRESDSRRHRSRFDQEPSPKRSRRDGKPATERPSINPDLDTGDRSNRDEKQRRRLRDALPLEAPDSKLESGGLSKESDKRADGHHEGTKHPVKSSDVPRPRSYFQHDERGNAAQAGRSFSRRAITEHVSWRDSKDTERASNRSVTSDKLQKNEKSEARKDDNRVWRHDGFFEMEAGPQPPARKRPAFREKKIPADSENAEKAASESLKPSRLDHPVLESEGKEDRGGHKSRPLDRHERPFLGDGEAKRGESQGGGFFSRDRYGGGNNYRGRERFNGRGGYRPGGGRVEKWKHDLFDEANRSPTPKNEEDQIAKVEQLLAS